MSAQLTPEVETVLWLHRSVLPDDGAQKASGAVVADVGCAKGALTKLLPSFTWRDRSDVGKGLHQSHPLLE